ncbi:hypothetical protein VTI74DRAFT_93 [Chaetomium olivicolor]
MNAQVSFLDGTLSLIHIPLDLYSSLLQPILKVLLPPSQEPANQSAATVDGSLTSTDSYGGFLNISVTPIECSIVCNSAWAKSVFEPAIKRLPEDQARTVAISRDTYAVLSVHGQSMDAGSRVADLTSPLALANIPIFFITTYYSDFILVPIKNRQNVVKTLLSRGFIFSEDDQSSLLSANPSPTSTHHPYSFSLSHGGHSRALSQGTVTDLQQRTFDLLKKRHVIPHIEPNLTLVQCTGIHRPSFTASFNSSTITSRRPSSKPTPTFSSPSQPAWVHTIDTTLYTAVIAALVSQPRFLSLTLAHEDPPSLLLDKDLLPLFGDAVVGPTEDEAGLVPIFLDLADLPFEATGIVSGVAGRLVREMRKREVAGERSGVELSYLSTARAGAVILEREMVGRAVGVLEPALGMN